MYIKYLAVDIYALDYTSYRLRQLNEQSCLPVLFKFPPQIIGTIYHAFREIDFPQIKLIESNEAHAQLLKIHPKWRSLV